MSIGMFDTLKVSKELAEAGFEIRQAEAIAIALRDAVSESAVAETDMARRENRIARLDERLEGTATKADLARVEARLKGVATKADLARVEARLEGVATKADLARVEKPPKALLTKADLHWGLSVQAVAIVAAVAALDLLQ